MAGRYKPYSEYKDSGIIGLNRIPIDWHAQRVKFLFYLGRGRVISQEEVVAEGMYPVYSSQTKDNGCLGYIETFDFDCKQITWTTDGANAGTVFLREGKHNCTNVCGTLQPKSESNNLEFSLYCLQYVTQFYKRPDTNGAKIMNGEMGEIFISLPSRCEQDIIRDFLDHETAKIDTLIEKQQLLIQLLKEKRQAVISHAVTKGLSSLNGGPSAKLRDSGVEWLGEMPEDWVLQKASRLFQSRKGGNAGQLTKEYCATIEGEFPVYSGQTENNGVMSRINIFEFDVGDLGCLFSTTVGAKAMSVMHLKDKFSLSQNCMIILPTTTSLEVRYFYYALQVLFMYERGLIPDHMQPSFRAEDFNQYRLPVPSKSEQGTIAEFLDHATEKFDVLISTAQSAVELFVERRTALISAAVTGKIDVRDWIAPPASQTNKEVAA